MALKPPRSPLSSRGLWTIGRQTNVSHTPTPFKESLWTSYAAWLATEEVMRYLAAFLTLRCGCWGGKGLMERASGMFPCAEPPGLCGVGVESYHSASRSPRPLSLVPSPSASVPCPLPSILNNFSCLLRPRTPIRDHGDTSQHFSHPIPAPLFPLCQRLAH